MAFDTKKWLIDELGFTEAEAAELLPKFEGERAKKIEGGVLRQSDYSRHMNELKKAQQDLEASSARLSEEMADWGKLTAADKERVAKLQTEHEKAQQDVLRLTQTVTRIATEAGIDPKTLLEGTATPPKKDDPPPAPDLTGYVKQDQITGLAQMALRLPAILAKISREHHALTGEHLDETAVITELEKRAGTRNNQKSLDPVAIWEELHEIPAKRDAKQKAEYDSAIAAAEQRGREAALSEHALPGTQPPPGRRAPVFGTEAAPRKSALDRPQPGTGLQSAVAAFRTGKYRTEHGVGKKTA